MSTIALQLVREAPLGEPSALPRAGTSLENPWVYDSVGREIRDFASSGWIEVLAVEEAPVEDGSLLTRLEFKRVR